MAQTDGKLGLNYAAGSEVTSWNDVAENMRKIDSFATQIDGKVTEDAAALEAFKGSVIDGADEIWATTQDGIPAGAHGVSRLITSVRTTITQKVAELTEKITANTTKADANAASIEMLNSNLDFSKNGVIRLGNILIQWGYTSTGNTNAVKTVTLREEFADTSYYVSYNWIHNASLVTRSWLGDAGANDARTTRSFGVYVVRTASNYMSAFTWLAIGSLKL